MRPIIVVLTGIDGTGKSSNARALVDKLTTEGIDVRLAQQFKPILLGPFFRHIDLLENTPDFSNSEFLAKMGNKTGNNQNDNCSAEIASGDKSPDVGGSECSDTQGNASILKTVIFTLLFCINLVIACLRTWFKLAIRWRADVVVFDRYYFDEIVKFERRYKSSLDICHLDLATVLFPQPCLVISLTADPNICLKREKDGDRTREEMWGMAESQRRVVHGYNGKIHEVNTEKDQAAVADEIHNAVNEGLPADV